MAKVIAGLWILVLITTASLGELEKRQRLPPFCTDAATIACFTALSALSNDACVGVCRAKLEEYAVLCTGGNAEVFKSSITQLCGPSTNNPKPTSGEGDNGDNDGGGSTVAGSLVPIATALFVAITAVLS